MTPAATVLYDFRVTGITLSGLGIQIAFDTTITFMDLRYFAFDKSSYPVTMSLYDTSDYCLQSYNLVWHSVDAEYSDAALLGTVRKTSKNIDASSGSSSMSNKNGLYLFVPGLKASTSRT